MRTTTPMNSPAFAPVLSWSSLTRSARQDLALDLGGSRCNLSTPLRASSSGSSGTSTASGRGPGNAPQVGAALLLSPNQRPSQSRTPDSTNAKCSDVSLPRNRSAFTAGMVMGFWTRNAPGFRNGTDTQTSRSDPRKAVVCGMTLMSARSVSLNARLRTSAGRTFSTIPKSTIQPSPRLGTGFLLVEQGEGLGRDSRQIVIGQRAVIVGDDGARDGLINRLLLGAVESEKLFYVMLGHCGHGRKVTGQATQGKRDFVQLGGSGSESGHGGGGGRQR